MITVEIDCVLNSQNGLTSGYTYRANNKTFLFVADMIFEKINEFTIAILCIEVKMIYYYQTHRDIRSEIRIHYSVWI